MKEIFNERPAEVIITPGVNVIVTTVNYDIVEEGDGTWSFKSVSIKTQGRPANKSEIYNAIAEQINAKTDEKIISGFVWNDIHVWLSTENQFNFSEADRKAEKNADILPITFKLGEDDGKPVYYTFETYEELDAFYTAAFAYINLCLNEGWGEKDAAAEWVDSLEL